MQVGCWFCPGFPVEYWSPAKRSIGMLGGLLYEPYGTKAKKPCEGKLSESHRNPPLLHIYIYIVYVYEYIYIYKLRFMILYIYIHLYIYIYIASIQPWYTCAKFSRKKFERNLRTCQSVCRFNAWFLVQESSEMIGGSFRNSTDTPVLTHSHFLSGLGRKRLN